VLEVVAPGSSCDVQGLARFGARCGSLVSPTPSSTFACHQVRPRGCRSPSARSLPEGTVRANLLTFAPLRSRTDRPGRFLGLLSWVPSTHPSHVSSEMRLSPLHRHARAASTPATTINRRFGSVGSTPEVPFRPRGFSPPRRFPPLHESRACCIPLPILGSTAFPLWSSPPEDWDALLFSRDAGPYPSKNSSPTAGARHRARCPLAVLYPITASPRLSPLPVAGPSMWEDRERRLRGLAPSSSLVSSPPLPVGERPAPSWASFLFKVLRRGRRSRLLPRCPVTCPAGHPAGLSFRVCSVPLRSAAEAMVREGVPLGGQSRRDAAEAAPDGAS